MQLPQSPFWAKLQRGGSGSLRWAGPARRRHPGPVYGRGRELQRAGVDILTIADCPIARARMDSSLLACKGRRELGLDALPHMTCRDRNLNATKALLLGPVLKGSETCCWSPVTRCPRRSGTR